ncbi:peptidase domain-containing ABC transporter [Sphingobacterium griseoflavum]|uniref:Bacteriocin cleavage/export ABC transporter n=1 Tax=Sphingobacterium griseoflavum TaxID=1474952 RepID=A0ABQ3HT47_9SPHI|nr:peptidase domain-containing ABC transporter [Sphingobacterium griseoflavum]GHE23399.1 bacteriocin cleavage/export ABC transporter [Sphingobacterium griseoflavum]
MNKKIRVKQQDQRDCGAACIASVAAHYGLHVPIAKIRQHCHTDTQGTNILGLVKGLDAMGFHAKGVKGDLEALKHVPLPAIAHIVLPEQRRHYVVIHKVDKNFIYVMDPSVGMSVTHKLEDFQSLWTGVLVLMEPHAHFEQGNLKTSSYQRFWQLIKPHRSVAVLAMVGAVLYTLLGLSTAIYVQQITDAVLSDGDIGLLHRLSIAMILLLFMQQGIGLLKNTLVLRTGQRIDRYLILGYYKHLLRLPQRFFDTMKVGEIISRVNDAVKIRTFINDAAVQLVINVLIVFFSLSLMAIYYWKLALIVGVAIPFYALVYGLSNRSNKRVERKLMEDAAHLDAHIVESLHAMRTIKQFAVEQSSHERTEHRFSILWAGIRKSVMNSLFSGSATEFLSRIFTIILLWVGATYVLQDRMTTGELLSFYALIGYFTLPVSQLVGMNKTLQHALIASDRLFDIMDLEREEQSSKFELKPEDISDIRFQNVTFRYGSRVQVLNGLTCTFEKGKTTAIVGASGSGKSTMAALLQQLYPVEEGKIKIGDYDIRYIRQDSLRSLIATVPQEIHLLSGNVIENIALGDDYPDIKRVIAVANELGISGFVEKWPDGLHTYLGENGVLLSAGQKQRIGIARALYRQPEILVLDEATSALDTASEEIVQSALRQWQTLGKTVIVIAHRLSTVVHADKLMVLHEGQLAEEGTHLELLTRDNGLYTQMWNRQFAFV